MQLNAGQIATGFSIHVLSYWISSRISLDRSNSSGYKTIWSIFDRWRSWKYGLEYKKIVASKESRLNRSTNQLYIWTVWKVILISAHPIGHIHNYDKRTEMQRRETQHFLWALQVKDAPQLDKNTDKECIHFIDIYDVWNARHWRKWRALQISTTSGSSS